LKRRLRIADALSATRLVLTAVLWFAALHGSGRLVGLGLLLAGATDFLDGHLARRLNQTSSRGAQLDSFADAALLVSATAWIELLHPEILRENTALLAAASGIYLASFLTSLIKFHRLGNLHLFSSRVAGGSLYSFALVTLITGVYEAPLLWLAAAALIASSAETLVAHLVLSAVDENMGSIVLAERRRAEIRTIHPIGSARKQRSQAPQSANVDGTSASPTSSMPISTAPTASETRA
jgi:phosphatidylglycerophosphate synthase